MDVKYVPLNPGSSFRGLHDSLVNHGGNRDPQLLLCLHEEIAVSLAHGYAKATGGLAVAAVHDLVGLMHASMAVYDAFCDRTPLLVLGGSGPMDPAQRRPVDWTHSATTQAQLVRDYVVWDAEPATPAASVADVVRARQRALSAPQGPAYVSPGRRRAGGGAARAAGRCPTWPCTRRRRRSAADPAAVARAAELLAAAERPVVVAGRVGLDPRATAPLVALVELLGAAYRDDRNVVAFPTAHPQNATGDPDLLREADVVLAVDVVDLPALLAAPSRGARGEPGEQPRARPLVIDLSHGDLGLRVLEQRPRPPPSSGRCSCSPTRCSGLAQLTEALRPAWTSRAASGPPRGACAAGWPRSRPASGPRSRSAGTTPPSRRPAWSPRRGRRCATSTTCSACATPAPGPRASGSSPAPAATSATPAAAASATGRAPSSAAPSPRATAASSASGSSATATCSWPPARCGPPSTTGSRCSW